VLCRNNKTGDLKTRDIRHVFLMTGANPNTGWLAGCLALDERGFVKTGVDLVPVDLTTAQWPLTRRPYLLEASLPGVFAVGDVRSGNVKRVASAARCPKVPIEEVRLRRKSLALSSPRSPFPDNFRVADHAGFSQTSQYKRVIHGT
jgi:hypothetical protein